MIGLTLPFSVVKKDIVLLQNHHFFDVSEGIEETIGQFIDVFRMKKATKGEIVKLFNSVFFYRIFVV